MTPPTDRTLKAKSSIHKQDWVFSGDKVAHIPRPHLVPQNLGSKLNERGYLDDFSLLKEKLEALEEKAVIPNHFWSPFHNWLMLELGFTITDVDDLVFKPSSFLASNIEKAVSNKLKRDKLESSVFGKHFVCPFNIEWRLHWARKIVLAREDEARAWGNVKFSTPTRKDISNDAMDSLVRSLLEKNGRGAGPNACQTARTGTGQEAGSNAARGTGAGPSAGPSACMGTSQDASPDAVPEVGHGFGSNAAEGARQVDRKWA